MLLAKLFSATNTVRNHLSVLNYPFIKKPIVYRIVFLQPIHDKWMGLQQIKYNEKNIQYIDNGFAFSGYYIM